MPLTVFDAVGKFSADTSQLDQFIVKLEQGLTSASEKAAAATQALKEAQDEFRASIRAVTAEGGNTTDNLERLAQAERNLALAAAASKSEHAALKQELIGTKEASSIASEATAQLGGKLASMFGIIAAAEGLKSLIVGTKESVMQLGQLSDKTGIAIETLAGIEHEAKSTGVSFEQVGTSLTRLSRAQALAIEGGQTQVQAFQRLGISVKELKSLSPEELFYRIADAMTNSKSHAEANASAFALLGRGGSALIPIFEKDREALRGLVEEAGKASGVTREAYAAAQEWDRQSANLGETIRAFLIPAMQKIVPEIQRLEQEGALWALEFKQISTIIGGVSVATVEGLRGMGAVLKDILHGDWASLVTDAKAAERTIADDFHGTGQQMKDNYADTTEFIKSLWKTAAPFDPPKDDLSDLAGKTKDLTAALKAELDQQLADIEKWKSEMHAAYASGEIDAAKWAVAEVQAADAADIAHEHYLSRLVEVYTKAGDAEKAHAAQLELTATETKNAAKETDKLAEAMEKHRAATGKVIDELLRLREVGMEKDFEATAKATEKLTAAEDELLKAQTKLAEDKLAQHYKDQEAAIRKLAEMHLITEEQKDDRLAVLEQQQANKAIAILNAQLAKEEAAVKAAAAKIAEIKLSPGVSPAAVIEAEANLKKLETAVTSTQAQIVQTQEKFNKQAEADDKSHYARTLLLAVASGKELLAEKIKQNHAALLAAQAELAEAKARGLNTTAIQKEITTLKHLEQELRKEAQASSQSSRAMVLLKTETQQAAQTMLTSFGTAMQAMITGQQSFGKEMEKATFQMLASMAQKWAEYYLALAIGSWPNFAAMAEYTAAAVAMEVLAAGLGALAGGSSGSHSATQQGPTPGQSNTSQGAGGGTQQTGGVTHLAAGGIVSSPTPFVAGDSASGGGGTEAVIPLDDQRALGIITSALMPTVVRALGTSSARDQYRPGPGANLLSPSTMAAAGSAIVNAPAAVAAAAGMPQSAGDLESRVETMAEHVASRISAAGAAPGGDTHIYQIKGLISPDNLKKVVRQQNRLVKNRQVHVRASDSLRLTRRSP